MIGVERQRILDGMARLREVRPGGEVRLVQLAVNQWVMPGGAVADLRLRLDSLLLDRLLSVPGLKVRRVLLYDLPSDLAGMLGPDESLESAYAALSRNHDEWRRNLMVQLAALGLRRKVSEGVPAYEVRDVILGRAEVAAATEVGGLPADALLVGTSEGTPEFERLWAETTRNYTRVSAAEGVPAGDTWPPSAIG